MDKIIRTLAFGGNVSLAVLETSDLVNTAAKIHNAPESTMRVFGGLLTFGAYLASGIKGMKGAVSVTVKAKDGDGCVSVSSDALLHVRGYADGTCTETLKGGTLTVIREDGYSPQPFIGTCEIDSDDVSEACAEYFGQSEQIPTVIRIETGVGGKNFSGGLVLQLLPGASDEEITLAAKRFEEFSCAEDKWNGGASGVAERFFGDVLYGDKTELSPIYRCNCSESKIINVLSAVGKKELLGICREQGEVKVHCHYCNKDYIYNRDKIEEIFGR